MKTYIKNYIADSIKTKELVYNNAEIFEKIEEISKLIIDAYNNGNKVLTAGNGGSAADAQHIAAEFVSKFFMERPALSAIALTTNTSILTSIGNDYSHDLVFARQVQAHGKSGDILIVISTSGNSQNIVRAVEEAKKIGLKTVGLVGENPSSIDETCDYLIKIPSKITPIIQESQIMIAHIICALVEKNI